MTQSALESPAPAGAAPAIGPAIHVEALSHRYPAVRASRRNPAPSTRAALDNVSFAVAPGEIFGILGPNGGGKTTLFRVLSTMLRPTAGAVSVFGHDVVREPGRVRQQLGVVFQNPSLDIKLTARENLLHQGHLYGLRGAELASRIDDALKRVNLAERQEERVERYSGGMRRRVELAKALLHHPRLLLLDEPATGLDPGARRELWAQLEWLRTRQGVTIALTTHLMDEADRCDRLAILAGGKLRAVDSPAALKAQIGGDVVTLEPEAVAGSEAQAVAAALAGEIAQRFAPWPAGAEPRIVDGKIRMERDNGPTFVATLAGAFPGRVRSLAVGRPTLDDVFTKLTGQALSQETAAGESVE